MPPEKHGVTHGTIVDFSAHRITSPFPALIFVVLSLGSNEVILIIQLYLFSSKLGLGVGLYTLCGCFKFKVYYPCCCCDFKPNDV